MDPIANILGEWSVGLNSASIVFRIMLTLVISSVVGCERSIKRHSAGLRTFVIISLASTAAMIIDIYLSQYCNNSSFLISAITILAVAIISIRTLVMSSRSQIKGITTAAGLWACSIIGLTSGAGLYLLTIVLSVTLIFSLDSLLKAERYLKNRSNHFEIHLELIDSKYLKVFVETMRRLGLIINEIEKNPAYLGSGLSVYTIELTINSEELKKFKTHKEIIEALSTLDYVYHIEESLS